MAIIFFYFFIEREGRGEGKGEREREREREDKGEIKEMIEIAWEKEIQCESGYACR